MGNDTTRDPSTASIGTRISLTDPERAREREDVFVTSETVEHDDFDHCRADIDGQVAVAVENGDGELLLLCNDELGIAILPHGDVESGDDWAAVARRETEGLTGISIVLDEIEVLREVDHVVSEGFDLDSEDTGLDSEDPGLDSEDTGLDSEGSGPEEKSHRTTYRVIFSGRPVGGEIQECKRSADAGSDGWRAVWTSDLPDGIDTPDGGPGDDLRYALDS